MFKAQLGFWLELKGVSRARAEELARVFEPFIVAASPSDAAQAIFDTAKLAGRNAPAEEVAKLYCTMTGVPFPEGKPPKRKWQFWK
jgi:hypothetical protein